MTRTLDDRPRSAPRWVRAAVLGGGLTGLVACGGSRHANGQPPTCGPCCHTPNGMECQDMEQRQNQRQQQEQLGDAGVDAGPVSSESK